MQMADNRLRLEIVVEEHWTTCKHVHAMTDKTVHQIHRALLVLLCGLSTMAAAQSDTALCSALESIKDGAYLVQESDSLVQVATRRPAAELSSVGIAAGKGNLAQYLTKGKSGLSVKWSSDTQRGPMKCGSFNAFTVAVDLRTVKIGPETVADAVTSTNDVDEIMLRRISGKASRDDLMRLREYYIQAGDLGQAKLMLEQALQIN